MQALEQAGRHPCDGRPVQFPVPFSLPQSACGVECSQGRELIDGAWVPPPITCYEMAGRGSLLPDYCWLIDSLASSPAGK